MINEVDCVVLGLTCADICADLKQGISGKEIPISLGNAEPTLNAHGMNAQEMCAVAEELSQFGNIFPFVTSRISTIPPDCRRLDIPKL